MKTDYYPDTDMLYISLADAPGAESEEVAEGFVFDFDADGKVVGIEVEHASRRVDLTQIKADPDRIVAGPSIPLRIHTISQLSEDLGVQPRTIQKTIQVMAEAGIKVGHRQGPTYPVILSDEDVKQIKRWRKAHGRGRPVKQMQED